jgi:hypothetical protein
LLKIIISTRLATYWCFELYSYNNPYPLERPAKLVFSQIMIYALIYLIIAYSVIDYRNGPRIHVYV